MKNTYLYSFGRRAYLWTYPYDATLWNISLAFSIFKKPTYYLQYTRYCARVGTCLIFLTNKCGKIDTFFNWMGKPLLRWKWDLKRRLRRKKYNMRGARVAQSVGRPASAQVMVSRFVGSGPTLGSVLTPQSLEPASDFVSPSCSAPPLLVLCLSLSLKDK